MVEFTVTVIDIVGIQEYIFGSNNLKQNVGASGLVNFVTQDMIYDELILTGKTNIERDKTSSNYKFINKAIEQGELNSELIYSGGGNTVILFQNQEIAKEFTREYTKKVLLKAPGLQLIICHSNFEWSKNDLEKKVRETIHKKITPKKENHIYSSPLLGIGVNADCQYTGLPASKTISDDGKQIRISREVATKLNFFDKANKQLSSKFLLNNKINSNFDFIYNSNEFGSKNESSYMAVVHIDGNGMGKRIQKYSKEHGNNNRDYIKSIRSLSNSIEKTSNSAIKATTSKLLESIKYVDGEHKVGGVVEFQDKLPFRPIVYGGDDITFVCDGRLGLTLSEYLLHQLTSEDQKLSDGHSISARAGIAIVKTHYPFYQALKMANNLAESAKLYIKEIENEFAIEKGKVSAMDWHFASGGVVESIESIRHREYTVKNGKLNMRPLSLREYAEIDWRSWATFVEIISKFKGKEWEGKHNKIMHLREALRNGPNAVEQFLKIYQDSLPKDGALPKVKHNEDSDKTGWIAERCICFDAIEALDFFVELEGGTE
jgi:CRISPR/Cas system-associated protein Cas10 (large subunit of type III CRISPR-Cas system)